MTAAEPPSADFPLITVAVGGRVRVIDLARLPSWLLRDRVVDEVLVPLARAMVAWCGIAEALRAGKSGSPAYDRFASEFRTTSTAIDQFLAELDELIGPQAAGVDTAPADAG